MNVELKAMLDVAFDGLELGQDALEKKYFAILGDAIKLLHDLPSAVDNFKGLQDEIQALGGVDQQADLVAYIQNKFKESSMNSDKAQKIVAASLKLVQEMVLVYQDVIGLKEAIQN